MADGLPAEMWLGKKDGEWPVQAFTNEAHAIIWMRGTDEGHLRKRRVWKVIIASAVELELVPPSEPYLRVRAQAGDGEPDGVVRVG